METDREKVLRDAKKIIDSFHKALEDVEKLQETKIERDECERDEENGTEPDAEFRKIMFKNAPELDEDGDCIKAERGKWV